MGWKKEDRLTDEEVKECSGVIIEFGLWGIGGECKISSINIFQHTRRVGANSGLIVWPDRLLGANACYFRIIQLEKGKKLIIHILDGQTGEKKKEYRSKRKVRKISAA